MYEEHLQSFPATTSAPYKTIRRYLSVIFTLSLLCFQNIDVVTAYECYQCVYTNASIQPGRHVHNSLAGKGMIPTSACSDSEPTIEKENDEYVEINDQCKYGCATVVQEIEGRKYVTRGCVHHALFCGNYTIGTTSQSCCKSDFCNGGAYERPDVGPLSCYQCVGSTRANNSSKEMLNVYNNKMMNLTPHCLDKSFTPDSPGVELNSNCNGGCLSATIPTDDDGNHIVLRGCASPPMFPCISMDWNRELLKEFGAGMAKYKNMAQKCCTSPLCNAGSAVNFVTFNMDKKSSPSTPPKYRLQNGTQSPHVVVKPKNNIQREVRSGAVSTYTTCVSGSVLAFETLLLVIHIVHRNFGLIL